MRKAVAAVVLLFLLLPLGYAQSQPDAFMEKFIEAFNTGNYSLIEPYMSDSLKSQFTEDYFNQIREFTLKNYGKLEGFERTSNSTQGDLVRYEYRVEAEKGSFPVLLAYRNGKLVGMALGVRAKPDPLGMILTMLGSLTAFGVLYAWKRKLGFSELVLGAGMALVLGIILPFYSIATMGMGRLAGVLVSSFLTAITIEGLKFYFARGKDGLSLGLGFGLGKYVLLAIGTFVATNFILKLPVSFSGGAAYAFLGALLFTAYHGLSAMRYSSGKWGYPVVFTLMLFPALAMLAIGRALESLVLVGAAIAVALIWR